MSKIPYENHAMQTASIHCVAQPMHNTNYWFPFGISHTIGSRDVGQPSVSAASNGVALSLISQCRLYAISSRTHVVHCTTSIIGNTGYFLIFRHIAIIRICRIYTSIFENSIYLYISIRVVGIIKYLTHWGRVTHICVGKPTIIGSDNGLSPGRRQAIIWTNAGILLIEPWEQTSVKSKSKFIHFHSRKSIWKCRLENGVRFVRASMFNRCFTVAGDHRSVTPVRPLRRLLHRV